MGHTPATAHWWSEGTCMGWFSSNRVFQGWVTKYLYPVSSLIAQNLASNVEFEKSVMRMVC